MGWTVRRIQENDYGCEEKTDKESGQVIVTLVSEEGYERQILADDDWLYANEIDEGDRWPLKFESVISPEVGLLCCGACNLQYDRDELVSRLPGLLPEAHLVKAKSGVPYAALLVIHGCPIACTSEFNLAVPEEKRVRMGSPEELPTALGQLRKVIGLDPFYRLPVQVIK